MAMPAFVLDTNIISEAIKNQSDDNVTTWLLQHQEHLYLTAITVGELWEGAYHLPLGKKRENLLLAIERISSGYTERTLAYDGAAAQIYARMRDDRSRCSHQLSVEDGMIAAICAAHSATLATRNTKDFAQLGIELVNPFEEPASDVTIVTMR